MLTESDRKKMAAAIFEGQESAYSLNTAIVVSDPTLAARHVQTILESFSICSSLLNSHPESSSLSSNNKRKRKRKRYGEEEELVRESPTPFIEDGFSWRNYGKKFIRSFPHPRSYSRCSERNCKARKHVQKIQDSPPIYRATYVGLHTCQADILLQSANESSMMLRFDQASTDCIDEQRQIPVPVPVPVTNQEYGDDQELLLNKDNFWVSDQLQMMFSHNDYDLDRFQI